MTKLECAIHDQNLLNKAENMVRESFEKALEKFVGKLVAKKGIMIPSFKKAIPKIKVPKGVLADFSYKPEVAGPPYSIGTLTVHLVLEAPLSYRTARSFWVGSVQDGLYITSCEGRRLKDDFTVTRLNEMKRKKESLRKQMHDIDFELSKTGIDDRLIWGS